MSEITTDKERAAPGMMRFVWLLVFAGVAAVYFFGLTIPLLGPDEPRYAQVAREMFDRGDWVTPTLGGFNWFEKPALLYWLEAASYHVFGVSEFAARFGSAIFGLGTVAALWLLGRFISRSAKDTSSLAPGFANWLALIAASSLGIVAFSRGASFDIIVVFPLTAAAVSFFIFDQRRGDRFAEKYAPLILFYVFVGLALLAKGLIGILFPFGTVGLYYILSRRMPDRAATLSLVWGTLLALVIAATWYVPMYERHGYAFIDEFFIQHHFQRFTSNKYQHPQPFYFFLWILPLMTLPWLPLFVGSLWTAAQRLFGRGGQNAMSGAELSPVLRFAAAWLLVPLAFFSFSGSKLPGYVLPAVPPAIVLTAIYAYSLLAKSKRWRLMIGVAAAATFIGVIAMCLWYLPGFAETDSVKSLADAANDRGYTTERVLCLHTTSHNAEFYFAGRILRDESGKQKHVYLAEDVEREIAAENGSPILVLLPVQYVPLLTGDTLLRTEVIRDNGGLAIARVSPR